MEGSYRQNYKGKLELGGGERAESRAQRSPSCSPKQSVHSPRSWLLSAASHDFLGIVPPLPPQHTSRTKHASLFGAPEWCKGTSLAVKLQTTARREKLATLQS